MYLTTGKTDLAEKHMRRAVKYDPNDLVALSGLNRIKRLSLSSLAARRIRQRLAEQHLSSADLVRAHSLLGDIEDAAGIYSTAFSHFAEAKRHGEKPFDDRQLKRLVETKADGFSPPENPPPAHGLGPLFIVGMPRSGTTLMESCLLRHSAVSTVGETTALSHCVAEVQKVIGQNDPWAWVGQLSDRDRGQLHKLYFSKSNIPAPDGIVIDKTPLNIFHVGFAAHVFENARFIFMSRHPLDTGLSNFTIDFKDPMPFTRDLTSLARMIRLVFDAAEDYSRKLPRRFRWQSFRRFVTSPEEELRSILGFLGLDWEPDSKILRVHL